MTENRVRYAMAWVMELTDHGYTSYTLRPVDGTGRWGYVINAGESGWSAQLGGFGDMPSGVIPDWLTDTARTFEHLDQAKAWVEEGIAALWSQKCRGRPWVPALPLGP